MQETKKIKNQHGAGIGTLTLKGARMNKYKLNEQLLDTRGGAKKLERDGFTRSQIIDYMYKATPGVSQQERTALVSRLYDRKNY